MNKIILLIIFLFALQNNTFAVSDPYITEYFANQNIQVKIHYDTIDGRSIRYIETYMDESADTVIFLLHGAKSRAMKFKKIMSDTSLLKFARIIALDRPGYDQSSPGIPMESIEEQTDIVQCVLDKYDFKSCILVGHSYGGAIVANYAAHNPDKNLRLLLLSAAIDPELEVIFPPSKMVLNEYTIRLMPESTRVASYENLAHQQELEKIKSIWASLDIPVYHMHGILDLVIPFENTYFSQKNINPDNLKIILLDDVGHSIVRFKKEEIVEAILDLSQEPVRNPELSRV